MLDATVIQAMAKWPAVPACYGWLALDRRGRWRMRDEYAQAHGLLGDIVRNSTLKGFIDRNYACTARGEWYFQNGPQRVYVQLEAAPFVFFFDGHQLTAHTGSVVRTVNAAFADPAGHCMIDTDRGFGLVCDRDLAHWVACLRTSDNLPPDDFVAPLWLHLPHTAPMPIETLALVDATDRFGFVLRPAAAQPVA